MSTPGENLRRLRTKAGLSAAELAQRVGRSESAVRNQENGTNGIPAALAKRYAQALGVTAAAILYGDDSPSAQTPTPAMLPIRRRVQAGAWLAVDDTAQVPPKKYPAARDPRFAADQWLSEVVGDSMDALAEPAPILEGDLVHCVDAVGIGYAPRTGDIVEAERVRFGGSEVEVSLKQVVVTDGGVELWPRSKNPRWREPLVLTDGAVDGEEIEVRISGLVIGMLRRFGRAF